MFGAVFALCVLVCVLRLFGGFPVWFGFGFGFFRLRFFVSWCLCLFVFYSCGLCWFVLVWVYLCWFGFWLGVFVLLGCIIVSVVCFLFRGFVVITAGFAVVFCFWFLSALRLLFGVWVWVYFFAFIGFVLLVLCLGLCGCLLLGVCVLCVCVLFVALWVCLVFPIWCFLFVLGWGLVLVWCGLFGQLICLWWFCGGFVCF